MKSFLLFAALPMAMLLGVAIMGCDEGISPIVDPPGPPPPQYGFPETADILMSNFKKAYSGMDWDAYARTLHGQFSFIFQQDDVEHLGLPSDRYNRTEELLCAFNMFNQRGDTPISKINFDVLDPRGSWQDTGQDHPDFPNTSTRVYRVRISIERPGDTTLGIEGLAEFFAVSRDSTFPGGQVRPCWELMGHMDRTVGAGGGKYAPNTWGSVKVMYRR